MTVPVRLTMKARAAVLGGGTMGTALANAVASGHRDCVLWSRDAELVRDINGNHRNSRHFPDRPLAHSLRATATLEEAVAGTQLAIIAVRSDAFRGLVRELSVFAPRKLVVFSATKGLEPQTNKRMSELIREETQAREIGAISGPNMTYDIVACRPTGIVAVSQSSSAVVLLSNLIELPTLRVFGSSDILGVELAGALKNVVALAVGLAAGLELGDNFRSLLIAWGLAEIQKLATSMGARSDTFMGLAGIGDLFLTSTSPHSRNHMVGVELGKGARLVDLVDHLEKVNETAEGINTVQACHQLALKQGVNMPLAECVYSVVFQGQEPRRAFEGLLSCAVAAGSLAAR